VADLLSSGPDRPRRRLITAAVVVAGFVAAVAVVSSGRLAGPDPRPRPSASRALPSTAPAVPRPDGATVTPVPSGRVAALFFDGVRSSATLALRDRAAGRGPWTVVVRRRDGSLGSRGAVVTFPVPAVLAGRAVRVGGTRGSAVPGAVVWPMAGRQARVRGDVPEADLVRLAARTSVVRGRPVVDVPSGYGSSARVRTARR
jgi:hypothetical protein